MFAFLWFFLHSGLCVICEIDPTRYNYKQKSQNNLWENSIMSNYKLGWVINWVKISMSWYLFQIHNNNTKYHFWDLLKLYAFFLLLIGYLICSIQRFPHWMSLMGLNSWVSFFKGETPSSWSTMLFLFWVFSVLSKL